MSTLPYVTALSEDTHVGKELQATLKANTPNSFFKVIDQIDGELGSTRSSKGLLENWKNIIHEALPTKEDDVKKTIDKLGDKPDLTSYQRVPTGIINPLQRKIKKSIDALTGMVQQLNSIDSILQSSSNAFQSYFLDKQ